jgi:hypothetical protein
MGFDDGKIRLVILKKHFVFETDFVGFLSVYSIISSTEEKNGN